MHTRNSNYLIHSETCIHRFLRDQGNERVKVAKYKLWENFNPLNTELNPICQ